MLKTKTVSKVTHRTVLTWTREPGEHQDRGEKFLAAVFKLIRTETQVGRLTVDFGVGGQVTTCAFEETETIPQREIAVQNGHPVHEYDPQ